MPQRIEVPGMGIVEFPDGMTDEQIVAAIKANEPRPDPQPGPMDVLRGWRDLAAGAVRGAGSIGATLLAPRDMLDEFLLNRYRRPGDKPVEIDWRGAMDAALGDIGADTGSLAFGTGKLGAEIAGTLGVGPALGGVAAATPLGTKAPALVRAIETAGMGGGKMLPRAVGGGVTGLASAGLVDPKQAGIGGAVGAATPAATVLAGKVGHGIGSALRPEAQLDDLARKAITQYGLPLSVSDVSSNQLVKGARSALDDVPLIGKIGDRQKDKLRTAFTREVAKTFGETTDDLSPVVMAGAKDRIGGKLEQVWSRNTLKLDGQLVGDLNNIQAQAVEKLNPEQASQVQRVIQSLLSKVDEGNEVAGSFANNWQSELRMVAESEKGLHKKLLSDLRRSVLSAFKRGVSEGDAATLSKALGEYRAFKTVEGIMDKANLGVAGRKQGEVPAALLPEAVRQSYGGRASPFGDLPQIGSQFVADRVARTGGSARAAFQNSALGTALALGSWQSPLAPMLGIPAVTAIEGLLSSPRVARAMMGAAPEAESLLIPYAYRALPVLAADR